MVTMLQLSYWYNTHETNCHCGPEQTRSTLMEYYWILRCRAVVKQTMRHCLPCRRMQQDVSNPRWLIYPRKDYPRKISSSLKQLVSVSWDLFLLKTMAGYLADMFCSSTVLLLEQFISQQTLQSTASGV